MKYNKLVRDRIPEVLKEKGETPVTHTATDEEYWKRLKEKLKEEVAEFVSREDVEYLADILEIISAICEFKKFDKGKIEKLREEKLKNKGGFSQKTILDEIKINV